MNVNDDSKKIDEIVEGLRARSSSSMAEAMTRFGPMVSALAGIMVRDPRDAEEVVQDTFISAFRSILSFNPAEASFPTWLGRIAYHRAVDFLRRHRMPIAESTDLAEIPLTDEDEDAPSASADELYEALSMLAPAERTLISLVYFEELPLERVAYIMNSNPGAISARLYRLKRKLARIINERIKKRPL